VSKAETKERRAGPGGDVRLVERLVGAEAEGVPGLQRSGATVIFEHLGVVGVSYILVVAPLTARLRRDRRPSQLIYNKRKSVFA
jgi:hypothetical protein